MLKGTISFEGKTQSDVEMAIEEALKRIKSGAYSGFDSNDDGEFDFSISGEEESGQEIKLVFDSEIWTAKSLSGEDLKTKTSYDEIVEWAEENGHTIVSTEGLDDED